MRRLFCAVDVPANKEIRNAVSFLEKSISGQKIKWVDPGKYHITLKFFGSTEERKIQEIVVALEKCAKKASPFSFIIEGCGFFGKKDSPSVIWLGVKNTAGLFYLYSQVNSAIRPLGYLPEKPVFVPHLTIGRIKHSTGNVETERLIEGLGNKALATIKVDSFSLMESLLMPQGPQYNVVERFSLNY